GGRPACPGARDDRSCIPDRDGVCFVSSFGKRDKRDTGPIITHPRGTPVMEPNRPDAPAPQAAGLYDRVRGATEAVRARITSVPQVGLILGSGLGGFADGLGHATAIDYGEIPHFPRSAIEGHRGRRLVGRRARRPRLA